MKRIMAALLALLLACAGALAEETQERAQAVLEALLAGEFDAIVGQFDDTMRAAVDAQTLESGLGAVLAQVGSVTGIGDVRADEESASASASILCENGSVTMVVAFDGDGRISALMLRPEQTAAAQERALPQGVTARAVTLFAGTARELSGELLLPESADAQTPYAVLVHGSGPSDMDETVGGNKPLRDLAYDLAALGVGTLRFDKVTYAHPELPVATIDEEYTQPVAEALRVLREETGAKKAVYIGHSEGGMLAPYLTQACGFDAAVALAGTPWQLWEISCAQNMAIIAQLPEEQQEALTAQVDAQRALAQTLLDMSDEEAKATSVFGISAVYLRHMAQIDEIALARDSGKPFLFLWGEADFQVPQEAFDAWHEQLGDGERYTYITYPGLNHLFMPASEGDSILNAQAAYQTPKQMEARVAQDIAAWLAE